MIVVDSNVIAYLYLPGEYTAAAEELLEQANSLQREAESLLEGAEFEVESLAVWELVRDSDCSAYDCEFIALAMKLDTKLVTRDKKLLRAFPKRAITLHAG